VSQLEKNGGIWKFDENKRPNGRRRACDRLRQMLALAWHGDALYVV
jgi:hypothetical protein